MSGPVFAAKALQNLLAVSALRQATGADFAVVKRDRGKVENETHTLTSR
jgi:hypothetical protein